MSTHASDDAKLTDDSATIAETAVLLQEVLRAVDSGEMPVGRLPGEMATRRRIEGAAAAMEALAENKKSAQRSGKARRKKA